MSTRLTGHFFQEQLIANNEKIQNIGKNLINKVEDLVQETKKQNNILAAIEALNKHMPVFHIYRQLQMQMKQKKYYPALKLLEDLENNYLPLVKHYRFSQSIHQSIPLFKEHIKADTINELNTFLDSLRVQTEKVGKIANIQVSGHSESIGPSFVPPKQVWSNTARWPISSRLTANTTCSRLSSTRKILTRRLTSTL